MFGEDGCHRTFLCRDSILLITLLLSECTCLSQLVFYGELRTWNEAYIVCDQNGGKLVSVNSSEMYDMIGGFSKESPWKAADGISGSVWIGIHATDSQGLALEWADCAPVTWTQWHPSEPKAPDTYQCGFLKSITTNFWTDFCYEKKYFICENFDSGACSSPSVSCYEATLGQTGTTVSSNTDIRPASPCVNFTDTSTATDPSDQISSTIPQSQSSGITTNNPSPVGSHTSSPETTAAQSYSTSQSVMTSHSPSTLQSVITQSPSSSQSVTTTEPQSTSFSTVTNTESQTDCEISATTSTTNTANCVTSSTVYTSTVGECLCTCTDDGVNMTMDILQSRIEVRKNF